MATARLYRFDLPGEEVEFARSLAQSQGFRVDSAGGRVGTVEAVRLRPGSGYPVELAVRAGRLGRRRLIVPTGEVTAVCPDERRLTLRMPFTIAASEPRVRPARLPAPRRRQRGDSSHY